MFRVRSVEVRLRNRIERESSEQQDNKVVESRSTTIGKTVDLSQRFGSGKYSSQLHYPGRLSSSYTLSPQNLCGSDGS